MAEAEIVTDSSVVEDPHRKVDNIECSLTTTDVCFHPHREILAVADITGSVTLYSYDESGCGSMPRELIKTENHKKSLRCVRITKDGRHMITAGKDRSWCRVDLDSGRLVNSRAKAHKSAIYSVLSVDENVMVTGDEDGSVKMWDMRRLPEPVMEVKENTDYISDLACCNNKKYLLVTSGDGTLSCINIKKRALDMQSESFDSEFLSVAVVKGGSKVIVGDGDGTLNIFNWSEWGNISDRYPGHPLSIDCIVPLTEDIVCTGCMDGKLRLVNILPNSIEKTFACHGDFPIESLSLSHDASLLATSSHDEFVKFWNVPDLENINVDCHTKRKGRKAETNAKLEQRKAFFDDLE